MKENRPLKEVPVPNYQAYREKICNDHQVIYPLKPVSSLETANLPFPLNRNKTGWPWDHHSDPVNNVPAKGLPKVSIIIPSYQQGAFIEEAIRSVLLQNYPSLELIIIDGGSTDETLSVLSHYSDFISLSISEKDRGQSHAINKGFAMASGEIFYWLNSDDYLNINVFNRAVSFFIKDKGLQILYGDGHLLDEETGEINIDRAQLVMERYLRFGGIILSHSVFWRSEVHCPVWEDLNCAMDAELWLRLFTGRNFKYCNFSIGVSRRHPAQKTSGNDSWALKWKNDYEQYIWKWYPGIKYWRLRTLEYRLVQFLHGKYWSR